MKSASNTVKTLSTRSKPALLKHFLALDAEDRRLRFGHPVGDEVIANYVAGLNPPCDGLFVQRDGRGRIVGAAHVALSGTSAEVGLSVLPQARGLGLGTRLFAHAAQFARSRGAARIDMHFLSENRGIQHIARKSGMRIVSHAGESEAYLLIPQTATLPDQETAALAPANDGAALAAA